MSCSLFNRFLHIIVFLFMPICVSVGVFDGVSELTAVYIELRALAELIGPYGMKHLSEGLMRQISCQVDEIKVLTLCTALTTSVG